MEQMDGWIHFLLFWVVLHNPTQKKKKKAQLAASTHSRHYPQSQFFFFGFYKTPRSPHRSEEEEYTNKGMLKRHCLHGAWWIVPFSISFCLFKKTIKNGCTDVSTNKAWVWVGFGVWRRMWARTPKAKSTCLEDNPASPVTCLLFLVLIYIAFLFSLCSFACFLFCLSVLLSFAPY